MKCYDIGILQAYIDGKLSPKMMKSVAHHLDICEVCQREFNKLIEINDWEAELTKQEIQSNAIIKVPFSQLQFIQGENNLPFNLLKYNKQLEIGVRELGDKADGTSTFAGFNSVKYPVTLDININKIGKVSGSWKGQIEIKEKNIK